MSERLVWCFFYGSFMNPGVMAKVGHDLTAFEVAALPGFGLRIAPHANLVRAQGETAFGILTQLSHATLDAVYASQSQGEVYLPEAVLTVDAQGRHQAATCYMVTEMAPGAPSPAYVDSIAEPAAAYGMPAWYVAKIRSFADSA